MKNFEDFEKSIRIDESKIIIRENMTDLNQADEIERVESLFETEFLKQDFIKKLYDREITSDDYSIDKDENNVFIEMKDVDARIEDEIEKDYNAFAKDFEKWAIDNDLYEAEILTSEGSDDTKTNITYSVIV